MHVQETILQRLGKALNVRLDDFTHEPLPERWVELIHHLNEQEQKASERHDPDIKRGSDVPQK
jgi:hypothetical protein